MPNTVASPINRFGDIRSMVIFAISIHIKMLTTSVISGAAIHNISRSSASNISSKIVMIALLSAYAEWQSVVLQILFCYVARSMLFWHQLCCLACPIATIGNW